MDGKTLFYHQKGLCYPTDPKWYPAIATSKGAWRITDSFTSTYSSPVRSANDQIFTKLIEETYPKLQPEAWPPGVYSSYELCEFG